VLSITRVKDLQQKQVQKDVKKPSKEFDNYFKYFSNRLDSLQQMTEKEKEQLRSFDGRRSNSVKTGGNGNGTANANNTSKKEKIFR